MNKLRRSQRINNKYENNSKNDYNEIIEASRLGDIEKVYHLYKQGNYAKYSILIGMPVELSSKGYIGEGVRDYFKCIVNTNMAKKLNKSVLLIPMNSFYSERIDMNNSKEMLISSLIKLVDKDIKNFDGVIFPGDSFNFPAIRSNIDPFESILEYRGKKEYNNEETIYGLTAKEFYTKYPEHANNPNYESLHYEAALVKVLKKTDKVIMSSCHGTQLFAVMQGAKMVAGIQGHDDKKPHNIDIKPQSMTYGYIGKKETTAPHVHKLAINPENMPKGLEVVGSSNNIVEIIEETHSGRPYYGYQPHPEFIINHPSIENFVGAVIQRNNKIKALKDIFYV